MIHQLTVNWLLNKRGIYKNAGGWRSRKYRFIAALVVGVRSNRFAAGGAVWMWKRYGTTVQSNDKGKWATVIYLIHERALKHENSNLREFMKRLKPIRFI